MSAKYRRTRVHSSIDKLPPEAREELDAMLADAYNGVTYADMAQAVEEMCGIKLSVSAIGRYAIRYRREAQQADLMIQRMRTIADYARKHDVSEANTYINLLIQDGLTRRILDGQDDISQIPIKDAMRLGIQAQRAATYEYRYRDDRIVREDVNGEQLTRERLEWLRGVLRKKPGLLEDIEAALAEEEQDELVRASGNDGDGAALPGTNR